MYDAEWIEFFDELDADIDAMLPVRFERGAAPRTR